MSLVRKLKRILGMGKSDEELWQENAQRLSETYPDTPDGTYRCGRCGKVKSIETVGNYGFKEDSKEGVKGVVLCHECAEWDRVGGEPPPRG